MNIRATQNKRDLRMDDNVRRQATMRSRFGYLLFPLLAFRFMLAAQIQVFRAPYVRGSVRSGLQRSSLLLGLLAIVGILLVLPTGLFASRIGEPAAITVLVFNFRHIPTHVLAAAESESNRIFEEAGVSVIWRDCPTGNRPCRIGPGRSLFLSLASGPVQNRFLDTLSGYALVHDRLAVVYYDYLPRIPTYESNEEKRLNRVGLCHNS